MSRKWYFAYGSNLDLDRYESRIKRAKDQGIKIDYDDRTLTENGMHYAEGTSMMLDLLNCWDTNLHLTKE